MRNLLQHLMKRIISLLITLFIITAVLYATVMFTPAETRATLFMPKNTSPRMTEQQYQAMLNRMIEKYHLNDPYPVQYYYWVSSLLQGNWGYSPVLQENILSAIIARTPATAELALFSILLFIPLGIISGVIAGSRQHKASDHGFRITAFIATSLPSFILALILLSFFYVDLHWFAPGRATSSISNVINSQDFRLYTGMYTIDGLLNGRPDVTLDALRHLAMPVFTLAIAHWATLGRITRATMVEEMQQDYVTAARARGLSDNRIVWGHTLRNAASPALTSSILSATSLLTGVYVVEILFNINGISSVAVSSMAFIPDASAALGFGIYNVILVWFLMLILDVAQSLIDPRIREAV